MHIWLLLLLHIFLSPLEKEPKEIENRELKKGEQLEFPLNKYTPGLKSSGAYTRGSYGGEMCKIRYSIEGHLEISELSGASGPHQHDLSLQVCHGKISREGDTLRIEAASNHRNLYLVSLDKENVVDSFSGPVTIRITSETPEHTYCPNLVSIYDYASHLVALPSGIDKKEIWAKKHEAHTIGHFSSFTVQPSDTSGRIKQFPGGDYILIGGNSYSLKAW